MARRGESGIELALLLGVGGYLAFRYAQSQGYLTSTGSAIAPNVNQAPGAGKDATMPGSLGSAPRGIRNNNPGNIRPGAGFQGETGSSGGYATFNSAVNGIRAIYKLLKTYKASYGLDTIAKISNRWAPASENNSAAWASNVALNSGVGKNTAIDTNNAAQMARIAVGIIAAENGAKYASYYPSTVFGQAWNSL